MSQFIYACPICHQHIHCDESKSGSMMKCPTCYQRVIAPQATGRGTSKLILTGQRYIDKSVPTTSSTSANTTPRSGKPLAIGMRVAMIGVLLSLTVLGFGGNLFHQADKWKTGDIGNVSAAGFWRPVDQTLTVDGSGEDIWGYVDSFRYVYQPLKGDVTLTARVLEVQNTDPWAKSGLMIRQSTSPNSSYAMVSLTPTSGLAFQQRTDLGVLVTSVQFVPNLRAPCWLRLKRRGHTFTADYSPDGKAWTTLNATAINMDNTVYAGLAVCSHRNGTLCRTVFDNVAMKGK